MATKRNNPGNIWAGYAVAGIVDPATGGTMQGFIPYFSPVDANGNELLALADNADAVAVSATVNGQKVVSRATKFNGTSWDRDRKPNAIARLASAAATTNATLVKASAGDVHAIIGFNASAAKKYLKLYNKATAPVPGTDTPVATFTLPVGAFAVNLGGQFFATGIGYALTGAVADADTTALAAGDIEGLVITYA